ncbi:hypothetical protein Mapa_012096 [Marchantia paleacea]|nr:hypothetical protein Mapa_012096 [Marchantia paleacea]
MTLKCTPFSSSLICSRRAESVLNHNNATGQALSSAFFNYVFVAVEWSISQCWNCFRAIDPSIHVRKSLNCRKMQEKCHNANSTSCSFLYLEVIKQIGN